MIDLQKALVADRIEELAREGAALRAERARAATRGPVPAGAQTARTHPATTQPVSSVTITAGSPRVRLGRWLVAVGTAIGGTTQPVARVLEDCTADASDTLRRAA